MIITYFRSSSYNGWSICQQQYFLTYVLGIPSYSGKKADMGTILHKVMETLANTKKSIQDNESEFVDDAIGLVEVDEDRLFDIDFLYDIYRRSFDYYANKSIHNFTKSDDNTIWTWTVNTLDFSNGMFDPRKRNIVAAEPHFDMKIDEPWAEYEYKLPNGSKLEGHLRIKGTIDLVTKINENHYETIDWKGLPLFTLLPKVGGWTTMQDISVGDKIFDQYGIPCNVIGKSTPKLKPCYRLTFNDKTEVTCDEDHLWKLNDDSVVKVTDLKAGDKIGKKSKVRRIIKIEKDIPQVTQCIMVDSQDNTYLCTENMIPTHNTGECKNWATGKEKCYADFCVDPQLRMYHYALSRLYPELQSISMTINYVRTKGPFTVSYCEEDIDATKTMLKKRFEEIKRCVRPKLKSVSGEHWFCKRVCWYGKNQHPKDPTKTICRYIADKTRKHGIEHVMNEDTEPGFKVGHYNNPGE